MDLGRVALVLCCAVPRGAASGADTCGGDVGGAGEDSCPANSKAIEGLGANSELDGVREFSRAVAEGTAQGLGAAQIVDLVRPVYERQRGDFSVAMNFADFSLSAGEYDEAVDVYADLRSRVAGPGLPDVQLRFGEALSLAGQLEASILELVDLIQKIATAKKESFMVFPYGYKAQESAAIGNLGGAACEILSKVLGMAAAGGEGRMEHMRPGVTQALIVCQSFVSDQNRVRLATRIGVGYDALGDAEAASEVFQTATEKYRSEQHGSWALSVARNYSRWVMRGRRREPLHEYSPRDLGWDLSWDPAKPAGTQAYGDDAACDIDRRSKITKKEFFRDYVDQGRPVLLSGKLNRWPARQRWTRKELLKKYGLKTVATLRSSEVEVHVSRRHGLQSNPRRTNLKRHVDEMADVSSRTDPRYMFQRSPFRELVDDYRHVHFFDRPNTPGPRHFGSSFIKREGRALFYVGGMGSGALWHQHTHAYNALVYGAKRWFLMPPSATWGFDTEVMSMADWQRRHGNKTTFPVLSCTQYAGELLYVPGFWFHGTINRMDSVGLAVELGDLTSEGADMIERSKRAAQG